jgi:cysteine synthase A
MTIEINWAKYRDAAPNILECIGNTPLVRLNNVTAGVNGMIFAKLEYYNPTGSLKDRIYYEMIRKAEQRGILRKGMTIIESSTGNAGISCAFIGGLLGYKVVIVMPQGMSEERKKIIKAYGAELIETPGGESDVDLSLAKVQELKMGAPEKYWEPAQFSNPDNISAHFEHTGPEIWSQTDGKLDIFVASQGTGGTLTGVGRFLKSKNPDIKLFAVEPAEAPLLSKRQWGSHRIEGIGDGFVPRNLDLSLLEGVVTTTSDEAIEMAKHLAIEEGIFCGISSGCNVVAALKLAKHYPDAKVIVTMINDTGQRYFSTELCDVKKELEVPERAHPIDDHSKRELDKYQSRWVIID